MNKVIGVVALIVLAGVGCWLLLKPPSGAERVKHMIAWDRSCADVVISDQRGWPDADEYRTVTCEYAGPMVEYARFDTAADMRRDVLREPPSMPVCVAGLEVTVDYLEPGQFTKLCRDLHGVRIDAIDDAAEPPWFTERDDAKYDAWIRASAQAQKRALERHWQH